MSPDVETQAHVGEPIQKDWWLSLIAGTALITIGIFVATSPLIAALVVTMIAGWALIFGGIAHGVRAFHVSDRDSLFWSMLVSAIYLAVGILLLLLPAGAILTLSWLIAAFLTADGIIKVYSAITGGGRMHWGWMLANGLASLILAALLWTQWPIAGIWVIGLYVGINLIFAGAMLIASGFAVRPVEHVPMPHAV